MQPKKNPKADVGRKSTLYFQIGMIVMLLLAWRGIEYKTYDRSNIDIGHLDMDDEFEEEVPITEIIQPPPPPPPPPPAPEIIDIVEDEEEVEETVIESTETDQSEEIIEIEEIEEVDEEPLADVPFSVIENVPIYPGCEGEKGNNAKKKCMSDKIAKFVNRKFDSEIANELGLSGRQRIAVQFKIDRNGNVVNVRARAPDDRLMEEAVRVVKMLPKMTPGMQRGKAVGVLYSLPILFQVQD